jgi:hypothetical protein
MDAVSNGDRAMRKGTTITRYGSRGTVFQLWEPPVPRIPDKFLDCVIYLYPDAKSADEGEGIGGSGFLAGVLTTGLPQNFYFLYAVTNKHVIKNGATTIRFSTRVGEKEIFETDERAWVSHPAGDDLAACVISFDPQNIKFNFVPRTDFISIPTMKNIDVGIGDDVFVVGRFISHEGKQQNNPTARFGCLAQMPWEPIIQDDGFPQESFLIEARSIGGFSGSPVFLQGLPNTRDQVTDYKRRQDDRERLIGIEWGLLQTWEPVCNETGEPVNPNNPQGLQVAANTGMMGVVPVWKLAELLDNGPLAEHRAEQEQIAMEGMKRKPPPVSRKTSISEKPASEASADDANPNHLADFTRLVDVAARKRPLDDQT